MSLVLLILFDPTCLSHGFQLMSDMLLVLVSAQTSAQKTFWAGDLVSLAFHDVSSNNGSKQG